LKKKKRFSERNQEIYNLWVNQRMTFSGIGLRYNLTRERIRQIVREIEAENV